MTSDGALVLAWLVLGHLVADFVLQTDGVATAKFGDGRAAWRALGIHGAVVAAVHAPLVLVFGLRGLLFAAVTFVTHLGIDRAKVVLTRRVEAAPAGGGAPTAEDAATGPEFDRGWTPVPGALFALDQAAHVAVLVVAWALLLAGQAAVDPFAGFVGGLVGRADPAAFHDAVLAGTVLVALLIVNVRAGSLFVATLVRPPRARDAGTLPSPARVGAVIGVLERLLICALVLGGAVATIGLVIAAKTLARFKQLDDREFAEYYLLGTLASVTIAVTTSLVALAALHLP